MNRILGISACVAAAWLLAGSPAAAVAKCKAKVDKKTGVIEVSASNVDAASFRWGPSSTQAVYAFHDAACVKGSKASKCTLGDPEAPESKVPPPACVLYLIDSIAGCTAWIPGCVPGVREIDFSFGQIGENAILDGAISSAKIAVEAVGSLQIASGAVGSSELAPGAVDSSRLAPAAVGLNQLAPNSVNATHIAAGAVGASEIADGSVGSAELADGSIGMAEVDLPAGNAGSGADSLTLEAGDNFHYGNATTFTPSADGRCLVVSTATIYTGDGADTGTAWVRTAREQNGADAHDGREGPYVPRIPDQSHETVTTSAVWDVDAGLPIRFGCFVFAQTSDFEGDNLRCLTSYLCH